jgi:predicted CxxxxCH...CXXCH cytochrome family protein
VLALIACAEANPDPEIAADGTSSSTDAGGDESSGPSAMHATNGQCVEHGMRFLDVFSCDTVLGPSPTRPPGSTSQVAHDPAVLDDPDYGWVLAQIEACSCTCCHSEGGVGSYVWSHDFAPAWTDSIASGDLTALGFAGRPNAIAPDDNFGFSRSDSGLPTTDATRLQAFVDRELVRRGDG